MAFVVPLGGALVCEIGAGSVFEVAVIEHGGGHCVCKRLKLRMLEEPAGLDAIERETELLRRLTHPTLPALVAAGCDDRGPYLVETRLVAPSLRALVDGGGSAPLSEAVLAPLARSAFAALGALHAATDDEGPLGFVHGDIAPDHLLVGEGAIHFIDLGQAHARALPPREGLRGTLPYVAPEMLRGQGRSDQAADVYALAASLAFAALGREPCRAGPGPARLVELAEQGVDRRAIERATQLSARTRRALLAALAFDPAARERRASTVALLF